VKKVVDPDRPHMPIACWIHEAINTIRICNTRSCNHCCSNGCRNESQCYVIVHCPFVETGKRKISKYVFEVKCKWKKNKLCNRLITCFLSEH
jgi:hypothetical protein